MQPRFLDALAAVLSFAATLAAAAGESAGSAVESAAPSFQAQDHSGKVWKLDDVLKREAVLLYFYPKDDTPGCTKEACGFRDRMDELKKDGVQVLGVSFDSVESHRQFSSKHNLSFPLLVDSDGKIADSYGARMPGKNMARRVSFLIGKDGKIAHVTDTPNAETHLSEMQEAVGKLNQG